MIPSRLANLVEGSRIEPHMPLAVAACDSLGRVEAAAQGTWPNGRPVRTTDHFYSASLAKQVTAAAAAVLALEGRIDPDSSIAGYVPNLLHWADPITVRHLVHHTAGLPAAGDLEPVDDDWTDELAWSLFARLPRLASEPGAVFAYSNLGYVLLAEVISRAAGIPFSVFVKRRLFEPLGLDGMEFRNSGIEDFPQHALLGPSKPLTVGDGGLWTTAGAFARWLHHQNLNTLGIADLVTERGTLADGSELDYGWGIGLRQRGGCPFLVHGGQWTGATAKAVRLPSSGIAIVALSGGAALQELDGLIDAGLERWPRR